MYSSLLLSLILILNYLSLTVQSRTCICAHFSESTCNADDKCEWNKNVPESEKNNVNERGECRSEPYMKCKRDPDCTLAQNDPRPIANNPPTSLKVFARIDDDGYTDSNGDLTNGETPTECSNCDWPFDCDTGMFYKYAIDVTAFELAARQMEQYEREYAILMDGFEDNNDKIINNGGKSVYKSFTKLQIVAGVSFIIILVAAMIYYQCKRDGNGKKYISLSGMDGSSYATFNGDV